MVFEVEDLLQQKTAVVHAKRLLLYRADLDGKDLHPDLLRAAEHNETTFQDAHALRHIREQDGQLELQVEWEGLPEKVDLTWAPLRTIREDLPQMLDYFLHTAGDRQLKQKALAQCSSE